MLTLDEQERAAYMAGDTRTAELLANQVDTAHLMEQIERYREALREALADLLDAINEDSDGDYFICGEARPTVDAARELLND